MESRVPMTNSKAEATYHPYTPPPLVHGTFEGEVVGRWKWNANGFWDLIENPVKKTTCTETMHVFTSDTWGGVEFCDCGKRKNPAFKTKNRSENGNDFPVRNEKPVRKFYEKLVRFWFDGGLEELWLIAGYAILFTLGITLAVVLAHIVWVLLSWYLVPALFVTLFMSMLWHERGNT